MNDDDRQVAEYLEAMSRATLDAIREALAEKGVTGLRVQFLVAVGPHRVVTGTGYDMEVDDERVQAMEDAMALLTCTATEAGYEFRQTVVTSPDGLFEPKGQG